jgi:hypothetical protein
VHHNKERNVMTSQVAIVAEIRPGRHKDLIGMLETGPPFDLAKQGFDHHEVFVGDNDVVFVFTLPGGLSEVERIAKEPDVLRELHVLSNVLQAPRLLQQTFSWSRVHDEAVQ